MTRAKARLLIALMPLGMAACTTAANQYPSLDIRDVERPGGSAAAAPADAQPAIPALPPASADLLTRLAGLLKVAQAADGRFQSSRAAAERAVAAAGSVGSDTWSTATVALARLESSRSSGMAALAELDVLYADARDAAPQDGSPSAAAIGDVRSKVSALIQAQDATIDRLGARLKS